MTAISDCSDAMTPSADEELTALPANTDRLEHELQLHDDLDLELAAAVHSDDKHDNDDKDDDGQTRPDHVALDASDKQ